MMYTVGRVLFWVLAFCIGIVVSAPVLFFIVSTFGAMPFNNFYLHKVEKFFDTMQHPPEAQFIKRMSEVDHYGNSNLCDFMVGDFRSTTMSDGDVEDWYSKKYPELFSNDLGAPYLAISFVKDGQCKDFSDSMCRSWLRKNNLSEHLEKGQMYLVVYIDHSHSAFGDMRCH